MTVYPRSQPGTLSSRPSASSQSCFSLLPPLWEHLCLPVLQVPTFLGLLAYHLPKARVYFGLFLLHFTPLVSYYEVSNMTLDLCPTTLISPKGHLQLLLPHGII